MKRLVGASCALLTVVLVGCGVPTESSARMVPRGAIPDALESADSAPVISVERQRTINLWFIRDDQLVRVRHTVPASTSPDMVIDALLAGPTPLERRDSLRSAIPDPAAVRQVTFSRGDANVSLSKSFSEIPTSDQLLAVSQLVLTLTDMRGVGRVAFTIDGKPAIVPLPSGANSSDPVTRDDYIDQSDAEG